MDLCKKSEDSKNWSKSFCIDNLLGQNSSETNSTEKDFLQNIPTSQEESDVVYEGK